MTSARSSVRSTGSGCISRFPETGCSLNWVPTGCPTSSARSIVHRPNWHCLQQRGGGAAGGGGLCGQHGGICEHYRSLSCFLCSQNDEASGETATVAMQINSNSWQFSLNPCHSVPQQLVNYIKNAAQCKSMHYSVQLHYVQLVCTRGNTMIEKCEAIKFIHHFFHALCVAMNVIWQI